jgi:phosphoheptose isomerase
MDADGDFVVVWTSFLQDGSSYGVYAQRYNSSGAAQGGEFRINTYTTGRQSNPAIAMESNGDFVVAWWGEGTGDTYGIFAQRYSAAGVAQGGEFRLNMYTTGSQSYPSIAMDADGDFVVTWMGEGSADTEGIYARRYDTSGSAKDANEFLVNSHTTDGQTAPAVAMDVDGDFVIAWVSNSQDTGTAGVYAQRYNASGTAQGGEFRVNTHTTSTQSLPSVAMAADGDFVVSWYSNAQDGDSGGIYSQRYNASGVTQGGEFLVNTHTDDTQDRPSVAMDEDGDFLIAWQSDLQDGQYNGIYAQRFG